MRATLDHPLLELNKLLLDEMKQLRDLGIYVGTYCQPMIPSLYQPVADPMETIRTIDAHAVDCVHVQLGFGIKPDEIKIILKDNPAKLM